MLDCAILITSAGRRCELIECFRQDAEALGLTATILAADLDPAMSPACQLADQAFSVPRCTAPDYVEALLRICAEFSVKLLVPTIDTELQILSEEKDKFSSIGTSIGLSSLQAIKLCQNKYSTAQALTVAGTSCPRTSMLSEFDASDRSWEYPLIFKPNSGSNSKGLKWASAPDDLPDISDVGQYLVQECKEGKEYTINCFFRADGTLAAAVPHERVEIRGGEVAKAITRRIPALETVARQIESAKLGFRGPICFQAIEVDGVFFIFEINARFGGGFPIAHRAGAHFPKWLLEEAMGIEGNGDTTWKDGVVMLRYDQSVFLND